MKIKKLFKFIPVVCLSALSCLSAVLSKDQAVKESYADSNYLMSSRTITNYDYTYTTEGVTFHTFYDFDFNFYNDISDNTFFWLVNVTQHYGDSYFIYNGNSYYTREAEDGTYVTTFTSNKVRLTNLDNTSFTANISLRRTTTNLNSNGWFSGYGQQYTFLTEILYSFSGGFSPSSVSIAYYNANFGGYGVMIYDVSTNLNLPSTAITSNLSKTLLSYTIDLTRSNYDMGFEDGYSNGYNTGFNDGYVSGNDAGYTNGYDTGYTAGAASRDNDVTVAYDNGYAAGLAEGTQANSTAVTIFSGILQVGMLPINVLLAIFNFEVLGINISSLVSALLTVCLTVIVIRTVTGSKE